MRIGTMAALLAAALGGLAGACGAAAPSSADAAPSQASGAFTLTSTAFPDGGTLPAVYTCDGPGYSPPLAWTGAPAGTAEFALTMTTMALDGQRWNWVLYRVPRDVTSLPEATAGVGTAGLTSDGPEHRYYPPCSKGPGAKTYTFTVYALSGTPAVGAGGAEVDGPALAAAMAPLALATARVDVSYTRP